MTDKLTADWGADSHSGSRIVNEDFIAFTRYDDETEIAKKGICLVVTDGSASTRCGQRAAQMAAFKILESYYGRQTIQDPKLALRTSLENALTLLDRESMHSKCDGMAVSIAAAAIFNGLLHVAWVGDARAYVLRNGNISTLTSTNDPLQDSRFLLGPARGILETSKQVESGDRIILCTDGIYRVLNDNAIATLATAPDRPEEAAQALIQGALAQHTNDNASAIVFDNGKALVKHTATAANLPRTNLRWIPMALATLGIVLFVAGSATLLSRRTTRPAAIPAVAPASTNATEALSTAAAIDPSAGQTEADPTATQAAVSVAAIQKAAPSATIVPPTPTALPTETPLPPTATVEPTATPAPSLTPLSVVTRAQAVGKNLHNTDTQPIAISVPATRVPVSTARPNRRVRPTRMPPSPTVQIIPITAVPEPTSAPPPQPEPPQPPQPPQPTPLPRPTDVPPTAPPPPPSKPLPPPPPPNA